MNFFSKKAPSDGLGEYEEIHEKKTTGLGYFLILIMAVFMIIVGETVFSDLKRIPNIPRPPAYCISYITNGQSSYRYYGGCTFTETDKMFGLDAQYKSIEGDLIKIGQFEENLQRITSEIGSYQNQINQLERQYDLSLQEKMAGEQKLYNKSSIQTTITSHRVEISKLEVEKTAVEKSISQIRYGIEPELSMLKDAYTRANDYYTHQLAWYRFKVFCLMLLFVLPFFVVSTNRYFALKRRNSQYTIIATGIMMASSFLFLQVVLVFLYDILPKEWIAQIISLFTQLPFFRYVVYYGSAILVIGIFGGLVYLIQKRIFDPRRVAIRRLKEKKCPQCSFAINPDHDFCPQCGLALKEACQSCGGKRMVHLGYCPSCGKTKMAPTLGTQRPIGQ
jgi:RNA polymerase subunit RPABC4/transcription elongation factor Spt4